MTPEGISVSQHKHICWANMGRRPNILVISGSWDNVVKHGKANAPNQRQLGVYEIGYTVYLYDWEVFLVVHGMVEG